jgi:CelD/BcsL family acetyltransferase involved in cellulose biosynthesis
LTEGCRVACVTVDAAMAHVAAWGELDARCLEPSLFNTPGFALPAARFIPGPRPRVLMVWHVGTGRLIGLCLLARSLPGWPARAWLHPQAVAAFPLLDRGDAARALAAMLGWATRRLHPGLLLSGLPSEGATSRLIDAASRWIAKPIETRRRAILPSGRSVTGLTGKATKEIRRQARRLGEQGRLSFGSSTAPAAVAADLEAFLGLEAAGWKGRRGTALGRSSGLSDFVRAMARSLAEQGHCRIDRLALDDQPIAMGIVLRTGPIAFYWKTAFDEAFGRFSPGVQLTEALSRQQAADPGLALTDSCAVPGHTMIDRLWPDRMTVQDVLVGPLGSGSLLGAVWHAERTRRHLRDWLKSMAHRAARRAGR